MCGCCDREQQRPTGLFGSGELAHRAHLRHLRRSESDRGAMRDGRGQASGRLPRPKRGAPLMGEADDYVFKVYWACPKQRWRLLVEADIIRSMNTVSTSGGVTIDSADHVAGCVRWSGDPGSWRRGDPGVRAVFRGHGRHGA